MELRDLYGFINIFNESKHNDHITTILTCTDSNHFFSKTRGFLKTVKPLAYPETLL